MACGVGGPAVHSGRASSPAELVRHGWISCMGYPPDLDGRSCREPTLLDRQPLSDATRLPVRLGLWSESAPEERQVGRSSHLQTPTGELARATPLFMKTAIHLSARHDSCPDQASPQRNMIIPRWRSPGIAVPVHRCRAESTNMTFVQETAISRLLGHVV
ncbi:hypothetical protein BJX61DRAFT_492500 [Aspergillus egyptiacus]|nr:hypothetical protein BJX61DRAFT_492500 [Aspergillus egyptiacus]